MERFIKAVWAVNGVLLLIGLLVGGALLLVSADFTNGPDDVVLPARDLTDGVPSLVRAIRLSEPDSIVGSSTRIVRVRYGHGYAEEAGYGLASESGSYGDGRMVNIIFLGDGTARTLFQQPALITDLHYPSADRSRSRWPWVVCLAAMADTDRDGSLDPDDRLDLYVTDLNGAGRHRILDDRYTVRSFVPIEGDGRLLVYALELGSDNDDPSRLREVAFIADPSTGSAQPYDVLNAAAVEAARAVSR